MIELADDAIALPDFNVVAVDHQERQIQRIAVAVAVKFMAADDLAACIDQKRAVIQVLTYSPIKYSPIKPAPAKSAAD